MRDVFANGPHIWQKTPSTISHCFLGLEYYNRQGVFRTVDAECFYYHILAQEATSLEATWYGKSLAQR